MAKKKTENSGPPRGTQQGRKLSPLKREMIWQAYLISGNKSEVAREFKVSVPTVSRVVNEISTVDADIRDARTTAVSRLAGKVHNKTNQLIDSIGEKDMERAALSQKAVATGIMIDKLKALHEHEDSMKMVGSGDDQLMLPSDAKALMALIQNRVKRLRILDAQLETNQPELVNHVQDSLAAAQAAAEAEATVIDVEDLDP